MNQARRSRYATWPCCPSALAVLSGGVAALIGLPMRFHVPQTAKPILVAIPLGLILLLELVFFRLRRSPSTAAIERFSKAIEAKRQAGAPVGALSRTFIALTGLLVLAVALGVVMVLPIE
jgi:hypothetical protein